MKNHAIKHALFIPLVLAFFGTAVMLLWNSLLPDIFNLTEINFWQALGLIVLARILLGGFGKFMPMGGGFGRGENHIHRKWMKMSSEERRNFFKNRRKFWMMNSEKREEFFNKMMSDMDDVDESSEKENEKD